MEAGHSGALFHPVPSPVVMARKLGKQLKHIFLSELIVKDRHVNSAFVNSGNTTNQKLSKN